MPYIQFMEALGNNFIIVDSVTQDFSFSKNSIPKLLDKEDFLEFDQVLVIKPPEKEIADFSVKIFNQDGSEAENCVNGMRCVARYLSDRNISISDRVKLLIGANQVTVEKNKNEILSNVSSMQEESENYSSQRRRDADKYAKEVLFSLEEKLSLSLAQIRKGIETMGSDSIASEDLSQEKIA